MTAPHRWGLGFAGGACVLLCIFSFCTFLIASSDSRAETERVIHCAPLKRTAAPVRGFDPAAPRSSSSWVSHVHETSVTTLPGGDIAP